MQFLSLLQPEHIVLDVKVGKKKEIIENLLEVLVKAGEVYNSSKLLEELMEREKLSSTGIGDGIAIPHKLTDDVHETMMVFGRSVEGLYFKAIDNKPVHLFFLVIGNTNSAMEHLRILSKLSRLLHDGTFRNRLILAESAEEVISIFTEKELDQN